MLSFSAVRVGLGEAGASCSGCGSAGKPGLAPAGEALFFASPKKSTQKKGEPKAWRIGALTPKTRRQRGRLFFGDFLLATQKKVTCRRATPGQQANHTLPITLTTSLSRGYKC